MNNRLAYRAKEVAELLGVTDAHIYNLVRENTIPSFRLGKSVLIPAAAVDALIDAAFGSSDA
jgi:excisionase family DNA binding protein